MIDEDYAAQLEHERLEVLRFANEALVTLGVKALNN